MVQSISESKNNLKSVPGNTATGGELPEPPCSPFAVKDLPHHVHSPGLTGARAQLLPKKDCEKVRAQNYLNQFLHRKWKTLCAAT